MTNGTLKVVWPWHSRSKSFKTAQKDHLKWCKLNIFEDKLKSLLEYKRNNEVWKTIKFGQDPHLWN